ncbi:MAG: cation-transporting P-type ATPase [Gammaproteobacteria bacterium]|jgi:Ca2+-transporting ATPase
MMNAYARSTDEVLTELGVQPATGLDTREVEQRHQKYGRNQLRETKQKGAWTIFVDQFKSPVVILLLIAALTAAAFGQIIEGIAIAAALVINAAIGFFTEYQALRSMEALRKMGQSTAVVRRNGEKQEVDATDLVPGDIVILTEGEMVAADIRLIEIENLQCNESALTGESVPVAKSPEPIQEEEPPLAERSNMAFSGTAVTRGAAEGIVVATGMDTEIGRISKLVEEAEESVTPLERRLEKLGQRLIYLVIIIGVVIAASGIAAGKDLFLMVQTAIVLAIAAVPEGLPIVSTVALGQGMWRMARRNALVKQLSAVETLGATTVVCSDKTGTLTENRMVLRRIALSGAEIEVIRGDSDAEFREQDQAVNPEDHRALSNALRVGVLCTNAKLEADNDERGSGDPTEVALLEGGAWADLHREQLLEELPEEREEAFDAKTNMMATYHRSDGGYLVTVKGAPEAVIRVCSRVQSKDGKESRGLDDAGREHWLERNQAMALDGLRVLAVAERHVDDVSSKPYEDLTLLGLVGLYDPPRETVKDAIAACRSAGMRVVMVTGDQPATAGNIAHAIGIVDEEKPRVLRGHDLGDVDQADEARREDIWKTSVFARVSPEQKLNLVKVYQDEGEVVAMTGDGVNDAPALKKADIGIAMGRRGTEVARETSDIVLKDDAFETIVMAVEQGRAIFDNIRRFIVFLLSGNLGQIIAVSAAALVNAPLPLLPLQILFLNLLLDIFPALAIGVSKSDPEVMRHPPRDPQEPLLTREYWWSIGGFGALIAASMLGAFAYALMVMNVDKETAVTISFLTYGLARLWHAFNMRSSSTGIFRNSIVQNPFVWGAVVICAGLLLAAVYVPFLASLLKTQLLQPEEWMVVVVGSLIPLLVGQIALVVVGRRRERKPVSIAAV